MCVCLVCLVLKKDPTILGRRLFRFYEFKSTFLLNCWFKNRWKMSNYSAPDGRNGSVSISIADDDKDSLLKCYLKT